MTMGIDAPRLGRFAVFEKAPQHMPQLRTQGTQAQQPALEAAPCSGGCASSSSFGTLLRFSPPPLLPQHVV